MTRLIVGLGNPGPAYLRTRHNVGFMAAGRLSQRWKTPVGRKGCSALFGEGEFSEQPVGLAMPQTFMNSSGEAVACLLKRWKLEPQALLVVCDDVALPLGMIRLREKGTAGGNMGLNSIIETLGTTEFARLRVGIKAGPTGKDLAKFVLAKFDAKEEEALEQGLGLAVEACEMWISHGLAAAMNRFNQKIKERN